MESGVHKYNAYLVVAKEASEQACTLFVFARRNGALDCVHSGHGWQRVAVVGQHRATVVFSASLQVFEREILRWVETRLVPLYH